MDRKGVGHLINVGVETGNSKVISIGVGDYLSLYDIYIVMLAISIVCKLIYI